MVLPTEGGGLQSRDGVHAAWHPARAGQLLQGSEGQEGLWGVPAALAWKEGC